MGNKKKRGRPDIEELLTRPWCYYCERDFDDLKILIDHQRAKHFKCERCGRRLNTAGGLSVHLNQVHKETLTSIDNALPNRSNLDVEIFGTEGIPQDVAEAHRQRVLTQYAQAEVERRAATGNPASGGAVTSDNTAKKQKVESKEDIKKRMAEFKAKKAAGLQQPDSGTNSPSTPGPLETHHNVPPQNVPGNMPPQQYGGFPQPYGGPVPGFQPQNAFTPPQGMPGLTSPPPGVPFAGTFSPPQPYPNVSPMMGGFPPQGQFPGGPIPGGFPAGPPGGLHPPFGAQSPPMPYGQQGQFQPPRMNTPPQPGAPYAMAQAHTGPTSPAGLPQRPISGAPPVSSTTMHQMHQGQYNAQQLAPGQQSNGSADKSASGTPVLPAKSTPARGAAPVKTKSNTEPATKKSKKDDKGIRMVYTDNEVSPEEKMAKLSKYSFHREPGIATATAQVEAVVP